MSELPLSGRVDGGPSAVNRCVAVFQHVGARKAICAWLNQPWISSPFPNLSTVDSASTGLSPSANVKEALHRSSKVLPEQRSNGPSRKLDFQSRPTRKFDRYTWYRRSFLLASCEPLSREAIYLSHCHTVPAQPRPTCHLRRLRAVSESPPVQVRRQVPVCTAPRRQYC